MERCLLVGAAGDLRRLRLTLDAAGVACDAVERPAEAELAVRTSRTGIVVLADSACDHDLLARLRARHPDRPLVAWLPAASTTRAAALLERGFVEVLDGAMGDAELLARLANASARQPARREPVRLDALSVDAAHGLATWAGADLRLTRRERELLQALAEAAPGTVRRETLYRAVWGYAMARGDRTVDVNVKRLRAKLAAAGADLRIATEPGVGYRLEPREATVTVL